jgi:capsular polysaccharide biosynthesis protein
VAASRVPESVRSGDQARPQPRTRLTADTSSQPDGITRRVMLNFLEAFFRRPVLHLLPVVLMLAVGVASVLNIKQQYGSVGTLSVTNESLLADLTNASQSAVSFESAATVTARQINELLRTDQFLNDVVSDAGVGDLVKQGLLTLDQVRAWTSAAADGDNIVRVGAVTRSPELSYRLSDATINSYRDWVVEADVNQSTTTETSLEARVAEKQAAADAADAAVRAKILEQPDVEIKERSLVDQQDFLRLQDASDRAQAQLVQAQDALDAAKLQTDQASAVVAQRLRVLDAPAVPLAPNGRIRQAAMTMLVFIFLGLVLSLVSVIISASLDRTIRVPNDITSRFGVDVLAVVPNTAR